MAWVSRILVITLEKRYEKSTLTIQQSGLTTHTGERTDAADIKGTTNNRKESYLRYLEWREHAAKNQGVVDFPIWQRRRGWNASLSPAVARHPPPRPQPPREATAPESISGASEET
ncbi:hypothetical protein E2C01_086424 [Portunus trituberculatus]|uniref:Uncharacterized protein n=1 Tax=Portunus trituberculatus TaxID=210409 RepID=A0A5B7J986_PORTR|nr:hypothetical protein [Portunus trituberculatus]